MLTWDEVKEAIDEGQSTNPEMFERHLANYVVQGFVDKITTEFIELAIERNRGNITAEQLSAQGASFLTGIQIGWYLAERVFHAKK